MKKVALALVGVVLIASSARAQTEADLWRLEAISGVFYQGDMAASTFQLDTTAFGGNIVARDGGNLDIDPAFTNGLRLNYRVNPKLSVSASWMHAEADYRVQFPALSSDAGTFDLEGLILGVIDQGVGQLSRADDAASTAKIDTYSLSGRYEFPLLNRWAFPYIELGGGLYKQKSVGPVFRLAFEEDIPSFFQPTYAVGQDPLQAIGVSKFAIDVTDWMLTVGAGLRCSLNQKWGVDLSFQDFIEVGADFTDLDATSTPAPGTQGINQLFQTTFEGNEGTIHNYSARLAITYAFWPADRPR